MIRIRLEKTFEIDNSKFEKWCYINRVSNNEARSYIKDNMLDICDDYLKGQSLKKNDSQSVGNLEIPIRQYYKNGEKVYDFDDMLEEFNYQINKLKKKQPNG